MAIIQISKIQHRTGANTDLPQLDEGELGFATDERKVYIGNDANLYPPAGLNFTTQTEILTQYSNISFSQIDGSANSNLELSNIEDGQVLAIQLVGDTSTVVNRGGSAGSGNIHLGNIANVKLLGGVNGYFLQTDGTGNISWVSKDVLRTPILALSNANPVVMTVSNATPYINKLKVTITGVLGANANTIVNGQDFYVKMSTDYPTSGNVTLYTDNLLTTPLDGTNLTATANTGYSTALMADTSGLPGGSTTQVQFNNSGVFAGSANLTFSTASNTLTTAYFTGTLTALASSQPNITSVGTLVDANIAGTVTATKFTSNVATGTPPLTVSSTTRVDNLNADLLDGYHGASTNTVNTLVIRDSNGSFAANIITANLVGNSTRAGTVTTAAQPNITSVGTLTSLTATGNVTGGNLTTGGQVVATSNVSGGNLTTGGAVAATGNVSGGNLTTSGVANVDSLSVVSSVTSNLVPSLDITYSLGNATNRWNDLYLSGTTIYIGDQTITTDANGIVLSNTASIANLVVTANITAGNIDGGNLVKANYVQGVLTTGAQPNITSVGTLTSLAVSGNISSGNANLGNLASANYLTGVITATSSSQPNITSLGVLTSLSVANNFVAMGNVYANSGTIGASLLTGTLTTGAQPNITSVGTLSTLGVTANITAGNVAGGNLVAANYLYGTLTLGAQTNITGVGTLTSLGVAANITAGNIDGGNLVKANYIQGVLTTGAQPNITSVGNLSSANVIGTATAGNVNAASGTGTFNTVVANNITLNNNLNLLNLSATGNVTAGANVTGNLVVATSEVRFGDVPGDSWGRMRMLQSTSGYGFSFGGTPGVVITNEESTLNQAIVLGDSDNSGTLFGVSLYSGTGGTTTGNEPGWEPKLTLDGNGNLLVSRVNATVVTATGNVTGGNLVTAGAVNATGKVTAGNILSSTTITATGNLNSGNASLGNTARANYFIGDGSLLTNIPTPVISSDANNLTGTTLASTVVNSSLTKVGTLANLAVTGNITSGNVYVATGNITAASGTGTFNTLIANNFTLNNNLNLQNLGAANISGTGNLISNLVTSNSEIRFGNVPGDKWGRMRLLDASSGYGFTFGDTPAVVITNEESTLNQALILGDASGTGTLLGVSVYSGGNGNPTTGNESTWAPKLTLDGNGNLLISGVNATFATATGNVTGGNLITSGAVNATGKVTAGNILSTTSITATGNLNSGNASLGNTARANYFIGDGSLLTNLPTPVISSDANNLTGTTLASSVINSSLTKVGTLANLAVTGNITSGNVYVATGNITAAAGTGTFNTLVANNFTLNNNLNLQNLGAANISGTGNLISNLVTSNSEIRFGDVPGDNWGRMRMLSASSGYGFTFGDTPALVITNEESTLNQALVLGDASGSGTLLGVSTYSGGTGNPTTGSESGWSPRLTLSGTGQLTVGDIIANSLTLTNVLPVTQGGTGVGTATGTGSVVRAVSPTLTGIPLAPTASAGTNTTQLATTAFVNTAVSSVSGGGLGIGQSYVVLTSSRSLNTDYTNTTGKPISVYARATSGGSITGLVDGIEVAMSTAPDSAHIISVTYIVPPGSVYRVNSTRSLGNWVELR